MGDTKGALGSLVMISSSTFSPSAAALDTSTIVVSVSSGSHNWQKITSLNHTDTDGIANFKLTIFPVNLCMFATLTRLPDFPASHTAAISATVFAHALSGMQNFLLKESIIKPKNFTFDPI